MTKFLVFEDIVQSIKNNQGEPLFKIEGEPKLYEKKGKVKVAYVKVRWKDENGNWVFPKLKFTNQIIASGIKMPVGVTEGEIPKNMTIGITKMKREQVEGGDYVVKKLPDNATDEEKKQAQENCNKGITKMLHDNEKFYQCLCMISDAFETWMEKEKVVIGTNNKRSWIKNAQVLKSYQSVAKTESGEDIELDSKFFRLIVNVYRSPLEKRRECGAYEGRIGQYDLNKHSFNDLIRNSEGKPIKVKGKPAIVTYKNADKFITYKSRCSGYLAFDDIVISDKGISLKFRIRELNVKRHRSAAKQSAQTEQDIKASHELDDCFQQANSDDEEDLDDVDEEVEATISQKQNEDIEKEFDEIDVENPGSEPEETDGDMEESDENESENNNVKDTKSPPKVIKSKKKGSKKNKP